MNRHALPTIASPARRKGNAAMALSSLRGASEARRTGDHALARVHMDESAWLAGGAQRVDVVDEARHMLTDWIDGDPFALTVAEVIATVDTLDAVVHTDWASWVDWIA